MSNGSHPRMRRAVRGRSKAGCVGRIVIALVIVAIAYVKFLGSTDVVVNPYTGEEQRISLAPTEEIALGLQARDQMARQHGGLHSDAQLQEIVDRVGAELVAHTDRLVAKGGEPIPYRFEFHLLADDQVVNAFALPGGQIFITYALFEKFVDNDGRIDRDLLAGVLGHEVGHVIARHSNEQMAKAGLLEGIGTAVGTKVAGEDIYSNQQIAGVVNQVLSTRYGREDEYHSDEIGAKLMFLADYDPRALIGLMEILKAAGGGGGGTEMMSTHPFPDNRIERLRNEVLPKLGVE